MVVGQIWEQLTHKSGVSYRKNENIPKLMMAVQLYKHTKKCRIVHVRWVTCTDANYILIKFLQCGI